MAKFLILRDANGGEFASNPASWAKVAGTSATGADKKTIEMALIYYVNGGQPDRVREDWRELVKQAEKALA